MNESNSTCVLDQPPQAAVPGAPTATDLLLCCARTRIDPKALDRLSALLRRDVDWEGVMHAAGIHGVLPLLYHSLYRNFPDLVPEATLNKLKQSFRFNVQHSFLLTAELLRLLDLFAIHRISAIPFKGPVLAASVYGDLSLRQFGDLDVLVDKEDVDRAGSLLISQGYRSLGDDGDSSRGDSDPEEVAYLGPKFYVFVHENRGIRVDLQWRVTETYFSFSLDRKRLQDQLAPVSIAGRSVFTFAPMNLLLILCAHGCKHRWEKMKWICDVAELVRAKGKEIDWRKIQQEASREGVSRMLSLGLFLAHELLGANLPGEILQKAQSDFRGKAIFRKIRGRLFSRSDKSPGGFERVLFYLRTKDRWRDRAQFCFSYLSQCLRVVVTPTSKERVSLPLPAPLFFIYYLLRPLRLMVKYSCIGLGRVYKRKQSGQPGGEDNSSQV
jgi:hypothetical protein